MKTASTRRWLIATILVAAGGCRSGHWFQPPGPLQQQQSNAVIHDPYPQADLGPSDAGARPPAYQNPLPEAVRNRLKHDAMPWVPSR